MPIFVALIRAVNVGGGGKLPMPELRAACEEAGFARVSTYIASGNLLVDSEQPAEAVQRTLLAILRDRFAQPKPAVILRRSDQLELTIAENPFPDAAADRPSQLLVAFADGAPAPGAEERLARYVGPERLSLKGDRLYVDYLEGVGRSKLTVPMIDRALGAAQTSRNWNTVRKLAELAR